MPDRMNEIAISSKVVQHSSQIPSSLGLKRSIVCLNYDCRVSGNFQLETISSVMLRALLHFDKPSRGMN